jgi:adenylate cyclase class 2
MYEVEVKGKLRTSPQDAVRSLRENGFVFEDPQFQNDTIFAGDASDITDWRPGSSVARIRTEGARSIMNVKTYTDVALTKVEHETLVERPEEAAAMLKVLGLKEVVRVQKRRQLGVKDSVTVCVDEVVGLGAFVEFELLYQEPPSASAHEDLYELALGFLPELFERVFAGYDELALAQGKAAEAHSGESLRP